MPPKYSLRQNPRKKQPFGAGTPSTQRIGSSIPSGVPVPITTVGGTSAAAPTTAATSAAAATTATATAATVPGPLDPGTAALPASIVGETLIEVNIGQRPFWIGIGPAAETRRRAYFTTPRTAGSLVRGEQEIIQYFGIDILTTAAMMPDFFKDLPSCTSDTKAYTQSKCKTVYQVLWMTKMSRTAKAQVALTEDLTALQPFGNDTHALDLAQLNAIYNLRHRDMLTIRVRELVNAYNIA